MKARARVVAEADTRGRTRLVCLRSQSPLLLRPGADGVLWISGGAAGPLAGDDLSLEVGVGPGATLVIRSVAASIALPGPLPGTSRLKVDVDVSPGGELRWLPEALVLARGCDHEVVADVRAGEGSNLLWREEVVLGRHREESGSLRSLLRVEDDCEPVLRQQLRVGPRFAGWDSPAVVGGARVVGSLVSVSPAPPDLSASGAEQDSQLAPGVKCERMVLGARGMLVSALGPSASGVRAALDRWTAPDLGQRQPEALV